MTIRVWTSGQQLGSKAVRRRRPRRSASIQAATKARIHLTAEDSEEEERVFKAKVAAIVRSEAAHKRFAVVSHPRFRPAVVPAVGGGDDHGAADGAAGLDWDVHQFVIILMAN